MYEALILYDVIQRSEQLFCGRNVTTCIYFDEGCEFTGGYKMDKMREIKRK